MLEVPIKMRKESRVFPFWISLLCVVLALGWRSGWFDSFFPPKPDFVANTLFELRDQLPQTKGGEDIDVLIRYTGEEQLDFGMIGAMLGASSGSVTNTQGDYWRIVSHPYAGDRILRASRTGDRSDLSARELSTYVKASTLVQQAKAESDTDVEVLLWLHDWLVDNIEYYEYDYSIESEERAQLCAIGGILDGEANCQGYTDSFYLLASLAGFEVDRQFTDDHTFNTIQLDGEWYIIDVTFNDKDTLISEAVSNEGYSSYIYFFIGTELCTEHEYDKATERNPISKDSGEYFYFGLTDEMSDEHGYEKTYDTIRDAADAIIREYSGGRKDVHVRLKGCTTIDETFTQELRNAARRRGVAYTCAICYEAAGDNVFLYVRFQ